MIRSSKNIQGNSKTRPQKKCSPGTTVFSFLKPTKNGFDIVEFWALRFPNGFSCISPGVSKLDFLSCTRKLYWIDHLIFLLTLGRWHWNYVTTSYCYDIWENKECRSCIILCKKEANIFEKTQLYIGENTFWFVGRKK